MRVYSYWRAFGLSILVRHDEITDVVNANHHIRTHKLARSIDSNGISIERVDELKTTLDQFFGIDKIRVNCNPQCGKCANVHQFTKRERTVTN